MGVERLDQVTRANAASAASAQAAAVAQTQAVARAQAVVVARAKAASEARARAAVAAHTQAAARAQVAARTQVVARSLARKKLVVAASGLSAHGWQLPITHPVKTSPFGFRWGRLHAGQDFGVRIGTPLRSMSAGTVSFAGVESGYGNIVQIRYWDGTISYFGHMSSISVHKGQRVSRGEIVGRSGNTGHSTGPHLHLEIHPHGGAAVDPLPWLASHHIAF
jgi:murein DD-endopeptidase MepM/ murein hydrolase activator NlpD